jgi:hypothetical protein
MTEVPAVLTAAVVVACLVLTVAVGVVVARGGSRRADRLGAAVGLAVAGWLVVTATVAATGLYATDPWLGVGVAAPLVVGLLTQGPLLRRLLPPGDAAADSRALAALAAVQVTRLVGGVFLVLLALDGLPPGFAVPAGAGDVLVGLLAPVVAYVLWRRPRRPGSRALGLAFNALGLLDLVVAILLGLLHAPGLFQLIVTEPSAALMGMLPLALIPTFVVPIAIVLHVVSFRLLARLTVRRPARV